jgi:cytochrome c nitrite reductase small subunit
MKRLLHLGAGTILILALLGAMIGLGTFTFTYGQGQSYMSTNPATCANCHIMWDHYDSWSKSSHAHVAGCADCHLPAHGLHKWFSKAENGFNHSWAFTFDNFHEPIQIKPRNARILQANCVRCHQATVDTMLPPGHPNPTAHDATSCVHCHSYVGHGPTR